MVRICAYVKRYGNFESLYLGNGLRYRDKTKRDLNGTIFSILHFTLYDSILTICI